MIDDVMIFNHIKDTIDKHDINELKSIEKKIGGSNIQHGGTLETGINVTEYDSVIQGSIREIIDKLTNIDADNATITNDLNNIRDIITDLKKVPAVSNSSKANELIFKLNTILSGIAKTTNNNIVLANQIKTSSTTVQPSNGQTNTNQTGQQQSSNGQNGATTGQTNQQQTGQTTQTGQQQNAQNKTTGQQQNGQTTQNGQQQNAQQQQPAQQQPAQQQPAQQNKLTTGQQQQTTGQQVKK